MQITIIQPDENTPLAYANATLPAHVAKLYRAEALHEIDLILSDNGIVRITQWQSTVFHIRRQAPVNFTSIVRLDETPGDTPGISIYSRKARNGKARKGTGISPAA